MANKHNIQPLYLMQLINTKYHEPNIHEKIEFDDVIDEKRLASSVCKLADLFPILKSFYSLGENKFVEIENFSYESLLKFDDNANELALN